MNINQLRREFPTLQNGKIYFDNASTSLTPKCVISEIVRYYTQYSCNLHRGEYYSSLELANEIGEIRQLCATFINAKSKNEIIFSSGATASSNMVVNLILKTLKQGDEIIITRHAHSSLFAPIIKIAKKLSLKVVFARFSSNYEIDLKHFQTILNQKTKAVFLSQVTNLYGIQNPIIQIKDLLRKKLRNVFLVIDAAQAVSHLKIDVRKMDCDFLFFSGHKMFGPTGVGILYGKQMHLNLLNPNSWGGGQITNFLSTNESIILKKIPQKFEVGTLPLGSIIGFGEAIRFIQKNGIFSIKKRINDLNVYLQKRISKLDFITLHSNSKCNNVVFTLKKYAVHDVVSHLDSKGICVRGGQHCAQLVSTIKNQPKSTIRVSLQFYNTIKEIDKFIEELIQGQEKDFLDGFLK